ncbi:MAG TPA: hypothetical protein VF168_06030 [Trueperaceae bacterium]
MNDPRTPLGVLLDPHDAERDRQLSRDHFGGYAAELLQHAGLDFRRLSRHSLLGTLPPIVLLPYPVRLARQEAESLERHVKGGGAVIACGGVEGADELFGIVASRRYLDEAVLAWPENGFGLERGEMPVWGAQLAVPAGGVQAIGEVRSAATPSLAADGYLGGTESGSGRAGEGVAAAAAAVSGVGATVRTSGAGAALYLAFDVPRSVVTMQQGVPVLGDAASAPDGSAKLEDGIRKSDDGAVIDWRWREESPEGPVFATPYADRLRELLVAAVVRCAEITSTPLALKWYWPDALPAVATLSFDTDSNEDADGWEFMRVLEQLDVVGTWCVMFPGGYSRALYEALRERNDEIALHYDALTSDLKGVPHCGWSWEDFLHQLDWLRSETGVERVVSQKNHVTRWEGLLELFRWVERAGITVDQTKGPSKIGNLGFNFGTCHLWRPMEDLRDGNRCMDLFELPFLTHDMHTSQRRVELRRLLVERVARHGGAAHFIFHPQRIHEEGMREALADVVNYARGRGLEWWTSERIARWEKARRRAKVGLAEADRSLRLDSAAAPRGLTVLLFGVKERFAGEGVERVQAFGSPAVRVVLPERNEAIR